MLRLRSILAAIFVLVTSVSSYGSERPNVIFIMYDDMGYGEPPSFRADSKFKTPSFDRLVREGMKFTDAHSAAANCTPTRYGVLTGRYPFRIGQFNVLNTYSPPIIPESRPTVASILKKAGYHTACIGKWHLGMEWSPSSKKTNRGQSDRRIISGPNELGFDYFFGFTHAGNIGMLIEQHEVVAQKKPVEVMPTLEQKAVAYLDRRAASDQPFFLYLPMPSPHSPHVPAPEFQGKTDLGNYGDWICQGDYVLGRVLETLEKHHLADNTLVIASADNGAAGRPYAPLRGAKKSIYEGGHREPFAARWPARIKPGTVCSQTISLNDLMATCAEIAGASVPPNAGEDSVSILSLLLGKKVTLARTGLITQGSFGDMAIRKGPWKLVIGKEGRQELYDLSDDISEENDVKTSNPEKTAEMFALMTTCFDQGRTNPGPTVKNDVDIHPGETGKFRKGGKRNGTKGTRDKTDKKKKPGNKETSA